MELLSSTDSSSEEELFENLRRARRPKIFMERYEHFERWNDTAFHARFRLNKRTVMMLLNKIENEILFRSNRNKCLSPMNQILLTLRFYATGNMLISIGDFSGVNKATAGRIIKAVSIQIARLRPNYIKIPQTQEEIQKAAEGFYQISEFPCIVGTIDCTHVRIQSPGGEYAEIYRCRKGYLSVNVQTVSDCDLKIRNIVARWPGSCHDQTIWNNSSLKMKFDNNYFGRFVLLGDSGYACSNYLITTLIETHNDAERLFNEVHIKTRNTVERQYGVLKRRFPVLSIGMRISINTIKTVIVATAVLHNIAIDERDELPQDNNEDNVNIENDIGNEIAQDENLQRRQAFINYFATLQN